jgi:hypothetical protein
VKPSFAEAHVRTFFISVDDGSEQFMASIDIQETAGPKKDVLGLSCFTSHLALSGFVLAGWLIPSPALLLFYLLLLPVIAVQWSINRRSCIINNCESWLRTGRWRDANNCEEGGFLAMLCEWLLAVRPSAVFLDRLAYRAVFFLWLLGMGHFSWLALG